VESNPTANGHTGSFLLELLQLAGWQLQVRDSDRTRVRARRGEVELEVTGGSLAEAAGTVFARAMRSASTYGGE
jgi:hypothetical protein